MFDSVVWVFLASLKKLDVGENPGEILVLSIFTPVEDQKPIPYFILIHCTIGY